MKKFFRMFIEILVIFEVFLFFGGYMLFDFSYNYYGAGVAYAFIITLILYGFAAQSKKIEDLEKRIQILEQEKKSSFTLGEAEKPEMTKII